MTADGEARRCGLDIDLPDGRVFIDLAVLFHPHMEGRTERDPDPAGTVAHNIRSIRKARQMTLMDLSAALGEVGHRLAFNQISRIENGLRVVNVSDLVALSWALDCTIDSLLHRGVMP